VCSSVYSSLRAVRGERADVCDRGTPPRLTRSAPQTSPTRGRDWAERRRSSATGSPRRRSRATRNRGPSTSRAACSLSSIAGGRSRGEPDDPDRDDEVAERLVSRKVSERARGQEREEASPTEAARRGLVAPRRGHARERRSGRASDGAERITARAGRSGDDQRATLFGLRRPAGARQREHRGADGKRSRRP
jgi:hypothetical protein